MTKRYKLTITADISWEEVSNPPDPTPTPQPVPPPQSYSARLEEHLKSDQFSSQLEVWKRNANNYSAGSGNQSSLQFPYYNSPIYYEALCNAAEALEDPDYYDQLLEYTKHLQSCHNLNIKIDSGLKVGPENGYSNPNYLNGARRGNYSAVENAPFLWMGEWGCGVWLMVHRIQQSKIATAEQKAGSVHQALWVTNNLIERYCTSSFWCDLNVYLERFAGNNDSRGGEFAWDDKFALMGTMLTYANYYLRKWGVPVPYFMSGEHIRQPKDRPAMDYQTWYRTMLGVPRVLKEKTEYHKFPAVAGSVIDENGVSWLDSHVADVFHDARRPLWWQAMDHCQGFRDSLTVEFHKGHGVGFVNACKRFLKLNISSRCLEVTERTNGTTLDVHHNSKPVWHWGQFCLRSEEVCNRFKILVDQAQLGYTDPCYKKGYDAMNYANILSWVALAEKANG